MCIILYHPSGAELPDKNTLKRCFEKNDDGAGFMKYYAEGLRLWKGFMTWREFWHAYRTEQFQIEDDFAIHFRFATSGAVVKGTCHPFPISDDFRLLHKTKFKPCEGLQEAVMHNGVFGKGKWGMSDTMIFVGEKLYPKIEFLTEQTMIDKIEKDTVGSKLLIFWRGYTVMTGHWNEDKDTGIFYSNYGWKEYKRYNYDWRKDRGYGGAYSNEDYRDSWAWNSSEGVTYRIPNNRGIECPFCEDEEDSWGLKFSTSGISTITTCLNCGCIFYRDTWEVLTWDEDIFKTYSIAWKYDQFYKKQDVKKKDNEEKCSRCGANVLSGIVIFDDTIYPEGRWFCTTCDRYF